MPPRVNLSVVSAHHAERSTRLPALRKLSIMEMASIAELRGWGSFAGLELLTQRALLSYGDVRDATGLHPAWIISDTTGFNAEARRIDGKPWTFRDGRRGKSMALVSGHRGWPIGASEIGNRPSVIMSEGQPDFCSSLFVGWAEGADVQFIAPVCMTGTSNAIDPQALPFFQGKHVRIAVHNDKALQGILAGRRWAEQLVRAGAAKVDKVNFRGLTLQDGNPMKDLADFATQIDLEDSPASCIYHAMPPAPSTEYSIHATA